MEKLNQFAGLLCLYADMRPLYWTQICKIYPEATGYPNKATWQQHLHNQILDLWPPAFRECEEIQKQTAHPLPLHNMRQLPLYPHIVEKIIAAARDFLTAAEAKNDWIREHPAVTSNIVPEAKAQLPAKLNRKRITQKEANLMARELLEEFPSLTQRALASKIGCSSALIGKLPVWKAMQESRTQSKPQRKNQSVKAVPLTDELSRLISDQSADARNDSRIHIKQRF